MFAWTKEPSSSAVQRDERLVRRQTTQLDVSKQDEHDGEDKMDTITMDIGAECEVETEMDVDFVFTVKASQVTSTASQTNIVETCNKSTETMSKTVFSSDNFITNPKAIHHFTGLENYERFIFVLNTLGPAAYKLNYMYGSTPSNISVENMFFLVLIKLRRHVTNFEISLMFDLAESDVYSIFCTWVRFMSLQWREIPLWVSQDMVSYYSPSGFREECPTTRIIVDGTECPIKKPNLPTAQQATFSTYKNRNTIKVLVGVSPGGLCSFVSSAYGGSTSDRQIVERSNLPEMCDHGDSIMSDKGFDVQDIFAPYNVAVNIPTFFRRKNRMSGDTVIRDRKIASKRVHVERFIGLAKTYKILSAPLNTSETQLASDIIFVCCMLCNFRAGIVPRHA